MRLPKTAKIIWPHWLPARCRQGVSITTTSYVYTKIPTSHVSIFIAKFKFMAKHFPLRNLLYLPSALLLCFDYIFLEKSQKRVCNSIYFASRRGIFTLYFSNNCCRERVMYQDSSRISKRRNRYRYCIESE